MRRLNGIHVKHHKNTENCETKQFPMPARLTVLMSQAMGAPCTPLVKKGDTVGRVVFYSGETEVAQVPVYAAEDAERNSFTNVWGIILGIIIGRK